MLAVFICGNDTLDTRRGPALLAGLSLGGTTLLGRALRSAQRAGATHALVAAPDDPTLRQQIAGDPWLDIEISWHHHNQPLSQALDIARDLPLPQHTPFWLATVDRTLHPAVFPTCKQHALPSVVVDEQDRCLGPLFGHRSMLDTEVHTLDALSQHLLEHARARRIVAPAKHVTRLDQASDVARAEQRLFDALRKPFGRGADGVAAYYINRPISLQISRLLVRSPLTPNHITFLGLLLGLVAALFVARGELLAFAVGGILLQASSIIDGVDGELARVRLTMSRSGEWFDTVADDVVNISFIVALGYGCSLYSGANAFTSIAIVTASLLAFACFVLYRELIRSGVASHNHVKWAFEGDSNPGILRKAAIVFSYLAKRDLYTLIVALLLIVGTPTLAYFVMVGGAQVLFLMMAGQKLLFMLRSESVERSATAEVEST